MKVTFSDFSSTTVNFIKCITELQANITNNSASEECEELKTENVYLKSLISG